MKAFLLVLAPLALLAGSMGAADAADYSTAHKRHAERNVRRPSPHLGAKPPSRGDNGWQPHDTSRLPFGSQSWWDQMLREGRMNGDTM